MTEEETIEHCIKVSLSHVSKGEEETDFRFCEKKDNKIISSEKKVTLPKVSLADYIAKYINLYELIRGPVPTEIVVRGCWVFTDAAQLHPTNSKLIFDQCKIVVSNTNESTAWFVNRIVGCDLTMQGKLKRILVNHVEDSVSRDHVILQSLNPEINPLIVKDSVFDYVVNTAQIEMSGCSLKRLESQATGVAVIDSCNIESITIRATDLILKKSILGRAYFTGIEFDGSAIFSDIVFKVPPHFTGTRFASKNVDFQNVQFTDVSSGLALGTFRQLKHMCEEAGYEHGVILFHGFELETHYNLYLKKGCSSHLWPEKFASLFHRAFTDYGRNLMQPFMWLLLFFLYGLIYSYFPLHNFDAALLLSFRNSIGPLIFALPEDLRKLQGSFEIIPSGWLVVMNFVQIVICSIIWFVTILMLRRRFKL